MKTFMQKNLSRLKKINLVLGLQVLGLVVWMMRANFFALVLHKLKIYMLAKSRGN